MVRQKPRKTVEELYAGPAPLATTRFDENFFLNSKNKCNKATEKADICNYSSTTCRKKSKPQISTGGLEKKDEKTFINEERLHGKVTKNKQSAPFASSSLDNKNLSFRDETEKDEDTEEFFGLIKETVENAVVKTLSDILCRSFREVNAKIDDLGEQLHDNKTKLDKIQTDINNSMKPLISIFEEHFQTKKKLANKTLTILPEIVHYGEENSRHFRYLCMKSEYDKMFYQHQNIMTAMPIDTRPNLINPYPQQFGPQYQAMPPQTVRLDPQPLQQQQQVPQQTEQLPSTVCPTQTPKTSTVPVVSQCNCHNLTCGSKSNISNKSSDMGIKEVKGLLEQLQKFYENQQTQDKDGRKDTRGDISIDIQDDSEEEEDDSSYGLSSPSIEEKLGAGGDS